MNLRHYSSLLALAILVLGLTGDLSAKRDYTKTFEESFALAEGGKLNIENLHGTVDIATWSKNEVEIKVTVTVSANSDRKAEDLFDRVQIDFSNSDNYVSAETQVRSKKSAWWFFQSWWGGSADLDIDYVVFMPASANLEVDNKYGDVELEDVSGKVSLNVKYGNVKIDHASSLLILDLAYGNGVIAQANEVTIHLSYGKVRVNDANRVDIDSKFSKVTIESANEVISESAYDGYDLGDIGVLRNEGKYDNFKVDKLEQLDIYTKYTTVRVETIVTGIQANMTYGGITLDRILGSTNEIKIDARYTGIELDLDDLTDYSFDLESHYTSVTLPQNLEVERRAKHNNHLDVTGYYGDQKENCIIEIDAEYGALKIR